MCPRASIPVVTAIVAVVVEHQIPGKGEAAGLLVLTGGVMLSVCSSFILKKIELNTMES